MNVTIGKLKGLRKGKTLAGVLLLLGVFLLMMYSYSRNSWGFVLSSAGWGLVVLGGFMFLLSGYIIDSGIKVKIDYASAFLFFMLCILILNNNYDIREHGFFSAVVPFLSVSAVFFFGRYNSKWISPSIKLMRIVGLLYAIMTFVCICIPDFYYKVVVPIMSVYHTSYTQHPSAGFTAHYSVNGIYLSMGFCTSAGSFLFRRKGEDTNVRVVELIEVAIMGIALLMNGKGGILICIMFALFVAYRNYTITQKRGRIFKLVAIILLAAMIVFIASSFIPGVMYFLDRFLIEKGSGDISNGRFRMWAYTWSLIRNGLTPFGMGWRWFWYNNPLAPRNDAHNCFFQLLLENGIVGSIPFFAFFAYETARVFRLSIRVSKETNLVSNTEFAAIYVALLNELFMIAYMFEGTAVYMPECMLTYFISCSITELYSKQINKL